MHSLIIFLFTSLLPLCINNREYYTSTKEYNTIIGANSKSPYYLVIKTKYIDNAKLLSKIDVVNRNTVVINQTLVFMKGEQVLSTRTHYANSQIHKNIEGKTLLLENVLVEAGIVYGQKGSFYSVAGSGLCNSCSVYSGYFSLNGKLLAEEYVEYSDKYNYSLGSLSDIAKNYSLPNNRLTNNLNDIWVFPPQKAGSHIN